jgi:hypothetical protein
MDVVFREWMVETAERYCSAAELLSREKNLNRQAQINAALSIEILLKSYLAATNLHEGEVFETYKSEFGHDLIELADKIPSDIRNYLEIGDSIEGAPTTRTRRYIDTYRNSFCEDRYIYETLRDKTRSFEVKKRMNYSSEFIKVARRLIDKTISVYIDMGSDDPWINSQKPE